MSPISEYEHVSVLLREVVAMLDPQDSCTYFDGTFGGGGYTRAILDAAKKCKVIACDRDPFVQKIAGDFQQKYGDRFAFHHAKFSDIKSILRAEKNGNQTAGIDGVVLDLGVSNFQISDADRGFSFKLDGPLDMSMGLCEENALDVLHECTEKQLADIIYRYGEEVFSRRIAKAIKLNLSNIKTTADLAELVRKCVRKKGKTDPATKTFQALRMFVNDELGELEKVLQDAAGLLNPGGKIIVVTFHSLEDRIVKYFFRDLTTRKNNADENEYEKQFHLINKKPLTPSEEEIAANPKSRSAKLRGICMLKSSSDAIREKQRR